MTLPERNPIRFAVMCPGQRLEAWQAECLRQLMAVPGVELSLLIVDPEAEEGGAGRPARRLLERLRNPALLFNLHGRLIGSTPRDVDMSDVFEDVPQARCRVRLEGKFSQYFDQEDLRRIREYRLDFILRFAYNILRGDVLSAARYGVWSYHHGDLDRYRGMPAGFWEIYHGDPVSGVTLQRLTGRLDAGVVLQRAYYRTVLKSYPRNRDSLLWNSAGLVAKVCRDLAAGEADYLEEAPSRTAAPVYSKPTNAEMVRFLVRVAANWVSETLRWLFRHEQWNVGLVEADARQFLDGVDRPEVQWYPRCARNALVADPFPRVDRDGLTVLVEQLDYRDGRGSIAALRFANGAWSTEVERVFTQPHHLSYPYLFEEDGRVYAIPEQAGAEEVAIYELVEFPNEWKKRAVLLSGVPAIDATLVRYRGRYWLFYAVSRHEGALELNIAHSPALLGPYEPHQSNPVKCDVRSTRPAGTPFEREGVLYRPAQDCARTYGAAVVLTRVDVLSPSRFQEVVVKRVEPDRRGPFPDGLHTLNGIGRFTVLDGKRNLFVPVLFLGEVGRKLRGLSGRRPRRLVEARRMGEWKGTLS